MTTWITSTFILVVFASSAGAAPQDTRPVASHAVITEGADIYARACANCHGADGRGGARDALAFEDPLPDFTDCSFSTREPNADWIAIVHEGGPARAFGRMMPAFGEGLTIDQIRSSLDYVRAFCAERGWPHGDLNLPRPLLTEKAFPEDEVVISVAAATEGSGSVSSKFVYERRFGARNQFELVVPFSAYEGAAPDTRWSGGVGDVVLGAKRAFYHDLRRGHILSAAAEIILPSGDRDRHFGKGTPVFEPFVSFGQILPNDSFVQFQSGIELPFDTDRAAREMFWRAAIGRSFSQKRWGRTWSPMLELVAARELVSGEPVLWDAAPQVQITLSTRQHIMAAVGVRLPLNQRTRSTQVLAYLLWDWFDGPLFGGW